MIFDLLSYLLGLAKGKGTVEFEDGGDYTFADPDSDGNVVIEKEE